MRTLRLLRAEFLHCSVAMEKSTVIWRYFEPLSSCRQWLSALKNVSMNSTIVLQAVKAYDHSPTPVYSSRFPLHAWPIWSSGAINTRKLSLHFDLSEKYVEEQALHCILQFEHCNLTRFRDAFSMQNVCFDASQIVVGNDMLKWGNLARKILLKISPSISATLRSLFFVSMPVSDVCILVKTLCCC